MDVSKFKLTRVDGQTQIEVELNGDITWYELTDHFMNFMRGCGYQVTNKDVASYLDELSENEE